MAEADCIVLVVDGQSGVTGADEEIVTWLRRMHPKKPVHFVGSRHPQHAKDIATEISNSCHAIYSRATCSATGNDCLRQ